MSELSEAERLAYRAGFEDGIKAYAWYKDGTQYVGTCGTTLKRAVREIEGTYGYWPRLHESESGN